MFAINGAFFAVFCAQDSQRTEEKIERDIFDINTIKGKWIWDVELEYFIRIRFENDVN